MLTESQKLPVVRLETGESTSASGSLLGVSLVAVGVLLLFAVVGPWGFERMSAGELDDGQSQASEQLMAEWSRLRAGSDFDLDRSIELIRAATVHSDERRISLKENWLQWVLGQLYPPASRTQSTAALIAGGVANCSERAQILKSLAETAGIECRFVGLSGHVVLEMQIDGQWLTADPDYGVVYAMAVEDLANAGEATMVASLARQGYSPAIIERYVSLVTSTEDNHVLPIGSALSPRLEKLEQACRWGVWGLPLALLVSGGCLLAFRGFRS